MKDNVCVDCKHSKIVKYDEVVVYCVHPLHYSRVTGEQEKPLCMNIRTRDYRGPCGWHGSGWEPRDVPA